MKLRSITTAAVSAIALASLAACGGASDDNAAYPTKRIEMVVPFPAGGATDSLARVWSKCLEGELDQRITVVNREGGQGALGSEYTAKAKADGYTLEITSESPMLAVPEMVEDAGYTYEDFRFIAGLGYSPDVMIVPGDSKYTTIDDLKKDLLGSGKALTAGTYSPTTTAAMRMKTVGEKNGFNWKPVPFDTSAELVQAVASGKADMGYGDVSIPMAEMLKAGKIRILAAAEPIDAFQKGVPGFEESGLQDFGAPNVNFVYLVAPKDVPDAVATTLEEAVVTCKADKAVSSAFQVALLPAEGNAGDELKAVVDELAQAYLDAIAAQS